MTKKNKNIQTILAIDTSCDDTSVAILYNTTVLSNIVSSQEELHKKWGGVVPDIARRAHTERIDSVIKEALKRASRNLKTSNTNFRHSSTTQSKLPEELSWKSIDAIAVTYGPGLAIALEIGIQKAQELAQKHNKPIIAVNHMEGHLLSSLAANLNGKSEISEDKLIFPLLGILISGGHTDLVMMHNFGKYEIVGEKLDDAIGEAYDKVARMLGLGYPGGPTISEFAKKGDRKRYPLPIPMHRDPRPNFSYSGLKTAAYYLVKKLTNDGEKDLDKQQIYDLSASFQYSAITHLQEKLELAIKKHKPKMLLCGGGVSASAKVRQGIRDIAKKHDLNTFFPDNKKLYMDNAAMIGIAAYFQTKRNDGYVDGKLDREPRLSF